MRERLFVSTFLFFFLLVGIVIGANANQLPGFLKPLYNFPGGDKVGHFILFGILSFLVNKSIITHFKEKKPSRLVLLISLFLSILIGLEEWSQSLFPSRTMSLADLLASYAGVVVFAFLAYLLRR